MMTVKSETIIIILSLLAAIWQFNTEQKKCRGVHSLIIPTLCIYFTERWVMVTHSMLIAIVEIVSIILKCIINYLICHILIMTKLLYSDHDGEIVENWGYFFQILSIYNTKETCHCSECLHSNEGLNVIYKG